MKSLFSLSVFLQLLSVRHSYAIVSYLVSLPVTLDVQSFLFDCYLPKQLTFCSSDSLLKNKITTATKLRIHREFFVFLGFNVNYFLQIIANIPFENFTGKWSSLAMILFDSSAEILNGFR